MRKYCITIYNTINGIISYEKIIKSNDNNIKQTIIEILQDPKVNIKTNNSIEITDW